MKQILLLVWSIETPFETHWNPFETYWNPLKLIETFWNTETLWKSPKPFETYWNHFETQRSPLKPFETWWNLLKLTGTLLKHWSLLKLTETFWNSPKPLKHWNFFKWRDTENPESTKHVLKLHETSITFFQNEPGRNEKVTVHDEGKWEKIKKAIDVYYYYYYEYQCFVNEWCGIMNERKWNWTDLCDTWTTGNEQEILIVRKIMEQEKRFDLYVYFIVCI